MADYKQLCAELLLFSEEAGEICTSEGLWPVKCDPNFTLLNRARAALAQPEPEGPTNAEIHAVADELLDGDSASRVDFARAVLARWGRPTPQPVPVSERLPGPGDCDAEGRCWWGRAESDDWSADWTFATHESIAEFCEFTPQTHWLPAHALPLPADG